MTNSGVFGIILQKSGLCLRRLGLLHRTILCSSRTIRPLTRHPGLLDLPCPQLNILFSRASNPVHSQGLAVLSIGTCTRTIILTTQTARAASVDHSRLDVLMIAGSLHRPSHRDHVHTTDLTCPNSAIATFKDKDLLIRSCSGRMVGLEAERMWRGH